MIMLEVFLWLMVARSVEILDGWLVNVKRGSVVIVYGQGEVL